MVMVMVVMVVMRRRGVLNVAVLLGTTLTFFFKLQGGMAYSVLQKLLAYLFLNFVPVAIGYYVHCRIVVLSVKAPYVNVMNADYPFDFLRVLADFGNLYAVRSLL